MDGSFGITGSASGHKLGVLLLVLRPVTRASAATGQGEVANLGDFGIVHGPLHEEVLSKNRLKPSALTTSRFPKNPSKTSLQFWKSTPVESSLLVAKMVRRWSGMKTVGASTLTVQDMAAHLPSALSNFQAS